MLRRNSVTYLRWVAVLTGSTAFLVTAALQVAQPQPAAANPWTRGGNWTISFVNPCISPKVCADWYDSRGYVGSCCLSTEAVDSGSLDACASGLRPRALLP